MTGHDPEAEAGVQRARGIVGARVIVGVNADNPVFTTGTVTAITGWDEDGGAEWVLVQWDSDPGGPSREALDELIAIGRDPALQPAEQLPQKWSVLAAQLAARLDSRTTDPRFTGPGRPSDMQQGYALACRHAAELVRQLAADLEGAGE